MHKTALPTTHNTIKHWVCRASTSYISLRKCTNSLQCLKCFCLSEVLFSQCCLFCLCGLLHETHRHSVDLIFTLASCTACLISQCHFFPLIVSSVLPLPALMLLAAISSNIASISNCTDTQIARHCLSRLAFSSVSHIPPSSSIPIGYVSINLKRPPPIPSPPGDLFSLFPPQHHLIMAPAQISLQSAIMVTTQLNTLNLLCTFYPWSGRLMRTRLTCSR